MRSGTDQCHIGIVPLDVVQDRENIKVAGIPEGGGVDVDYDPDKDDEGDILTQTMSGNSDSAKSGRFS